MIFLAYEPVVVAGEDIAIDLLIWRRFKRPMAGLLEALLDLPDNQHLADLPAILPLGTRVVIPIPQERETRIALVVSLWD